MVVGISTRLLTSVSPERQRRIFAVMLTSFLVSGVGISCRTARQSSWVCMSWIPSAFHSLGVLISAGTSLADRRYGARDTFSRGWRASKLVFKNTAVFSFQTTAFLSTSRPWKSFLSSELSSANFSSFSKYMYTFRVVSVKNVSSALLSALTLVHLLRFFKC